MRALGPSHFNVNADYTPYTFLHYYQQLHHVLELKPSSVLVIGVGDHLVSDFLRRKGIVVKTLDNDPDLHPDYLKDVRAQLDIANTFTVVLASEVFEHFRFSQFEDAIVNLKPVVGKFLVLSIPYPTIRLFPARTKYGRIVSCEGRLYTYLPLQPYQDLINFLRFLKRLIRFRFHVFSAWRAAFIKSDLPDNKLDVHHWDLSQRGAGRRVVREILRKHFRLIMEKAYVNTNCVFYVLERPSET